LVTPVQAVHQASDVIPVIADSKLARDQFGDARRCPHVGTVTLRQGPFQQHPQQTTLLGRRQLGRPTGRGANLQSFDAMPPPSIVPSHHGTGRTLDAPSRLV